MAVAETAQLVAELSLRDQLSGRVGNVNRSLNGLDAASRKAGRSIGLLGHTLSTALGVGVERVVEGGIRSLISSIQSGVAGAQELEAQQAQTQAAIKSTGGVAGVTADQVRKLAEQYESLNATIDDKVIQSAENMLLTFTKVDKRAFEPAIKAALDMNTRMGGGEQGLQGTLIQVGKALQDPIRGVTALRRVGVQLSDAQLKQIKQLVAQNKLYDAQKIILRELNTEFGGSFLAQGETDAAKAAKLTDSLDDLKIAMAQGLMPGIRNVRDALTDLFSDPQTVADVKHFGETLAGFLTRENIDRGVQGVKDLFGFLKTVPWGAIGAGLKISADATQSIVGAFLKLPPQAQTAIVVGFAANKLSGGILTDLAGGLLGGAAGGLGRRIFGGGRGAAGIAAGAAGGLLGQGATPANPLYVAVVNGGIPGTDIPGGVAGAAGKGGGIAALLRGAIPATLLAAMVAEAVRETGQFADINNQLGGLGLTSAEIAAVKSANSEHRPGERRTAIDAKAIETGTAKLQQLGLQLVQKSDGTFQLLQKNVLGGGAEVGKRTAGMAAQTAAQTAKTTTEQTLKNLGFTPNMGPKDRKPILEQGKRTGTDLFGEQALAVFRQAANPKDPKVFGEISRHITELRDIEKTYLRAGNVEAARHAQRTIEKMEKLIGVTSRDDSRSKAAIDKLASQQNHHASVNAARTAAMLMASRQSAAKLAAIPPHLSRIEGADAKTAANTNEIKHKRFDPTVNVNVSTNISISNVERKIIQMRTAAGHGFTER